MHAEDVLQSGLKELAGRARLAHLAVDRSMSQATSCPSPRSCTGVECQQRLEVVHHEVDPRLRARYWQPARCLGRTSGGRWHHPVASAPGNRLERIRVRHQIPKMTKRRQEKLFGSDPTLRLAYRAIASSQRMLCDCARDSVKIAEVFKQCQAAVAEAKEALLRFEQSKKY